MTDKSFFWFKEKELLKKKQEEIEEAERAKRNKVVVTFDLVGRKVIIFMDRPPSLALKYIIEKLASPGSLCILLLLRILDDLAY